VLEPLLGIGSEAMAKQSNLTYSHDLRETLGRVAASEVQAAFLMNATKVGQVLDACEAGFVLHAEVDLLPAQAGHRLGDGAHRSRRGAGAAQGMSSADDARAPDAESEAVTHDTLLRGGSS